MTDLKRLLVAPKGMGLNDFVAMKEGFFRDEGLDVEFDIRTFHGTQSSWKGLDYLERPQDRPYFEKRDVIQGASAWGSVCNAGAGMGRFIKDCYGVSPWAIFVRAESNIFEPAQLKNVPIAVGLRGGSHFNLPYRLEPYMRLDEIKTASIGGFGARLISLIQGEVEAASLLPPQIAMAEQLGLRKVIENTFRTFWWAPEMASPGVVTGYLRALDHAERALEADLSKYLPLWAQAVPPEFISCDWDYLRFERGERFVYAPIPESEFDEILAQVNRWGLGDYIKESRFEKLAFETTSNRP